MASGGSSMMDTMVNSASILFQKITRGEKSFGILVIGDTGSGKSTLTNNILGKVVAKVGETTYSETAIITPYDGNVQGVHVKIYDTPGLEDSADDPQLEEKHLQDMKAVMDRGEIALVIFCFKMTETRMSSKNIHTFKTYHRRLHLNWKKVIIALTFADVVGYMKQDKPPAEVYQRKLQLLKDHIGNVLREKVGVAIGDEDLRIHPTTETYETPLPNGEEWFKPLWFSVMKILDPQQFFNYFKMHAVNIHMSGPPPLTDEEAKEIRDIIPCHHTPSHGELQLSQSVQQVSKSRTSSVSCGQVVGPNSIMTIVKCEVTETFQPPKLILNAPEQESFKTLLSKAVKAVVKVPEYAARKIAKGIMAGWNKLKTLIS